MQMPNSANRCRTVDDVVATGRPRGSRSAWHHERDRMASPQLEARPDAPADGFHHGLTIPDRVPEISAQEPAHPRRVWM